MVLSSHSSETDSLISNEIPEIQASKKRKMSEKMVVSVKIEEKFEGKTSRSELGPPPSDCWSWRKYGQKPIKGSPYPRGYYKCSTSKGCLAKKQVERCRTNASMLIITYTSTHNHPTPNNLTKEPKPLKSQQIEPENEDQEQENEEEVEVEVEVEQEQPLQVTTSNAEGTSTENDFYYCQSPIRSSEEGIIHISHDEIVENHLVLEEEPISYPHLMTLTTVFKSEGENDFYDELEELPMSSSFFTSFMRGNFFEERILV